MWQTRRWKEVAITRALKELEGLHLVETSDGKIQLGNSDAYRREQYRRLFVRETEWMLEPYDRTGAAAHLRILLEETLILISKTMPETRAWPHDLDERIKTGDTLSHLELKDKALRDRLFERIGLLPDQRTTVV